MSGMQFDLFGGGQDDEASSLGIKGHKTRPEQTVLPAVHEPSLITLRERLPENIALGTSSWSFPGWNKLVFADDYAESTLARSGLMAYASHPLLRAVGIDRTFYAPLSTEAYRRYAVQVDRVQLAFRFVVKAPMLFTATSMRGDNGDWHDNPVFLNAEHAAAQFVEPAVSGLGSHCGALVFQFPPLGPRYTRNPLAFADDLAEFLLRLPPLYGQACYAVEIRDPALLTDDYLAALCAGNATHCLAVHARMPSVSQQARFWRESGQHPLVVRWSLHGGFKYETAKARYAPFDKLIDEDPQSRAEIAELACEAAALMRTSMVIINNKAEGSAPLSVHKLAEKIVTISGQNRPAA